MNSPPDPIISVVTIAAKSLECTARLSPSGGLFVFSTVRMFEIGTAFVAALSLIGDAYGQAKAKPLTRLELNAGLATTVNVDVLAQKMELGQALKLLDELVAKKGKRIAVGVDDDAFKKRVSEELDVSKSNIELPRFTDETNPIATFTAKQVLQMLQRRVLNSREVVLIVKGGEVKFSHGDEVRGDQAEIGGQVVWLTKKGFLPTAEFGWFEAVPTAPPSKFFPFFLTPEIPLEQKATAAEVYAVLNLPLDANLIPALQPGASLRTVAAQVRKYAKSKFKKLPIYVDEQSFARNAPNGPAIWDAPFSPPPAKKKETVGQFLVRSSENAPQLQAGLVVSGGALVIAHKSEVGYYPRSK